MSATILSNYTPLHSAAYLGDLEQVKNLVRSGSNIGARDGRGCIPLMYAVIRDHELVAKFLVKEMSDQELEAVDNESNNVLHMMALYNRKWPQVLQYICDKKGSLINQEDIFGYRPIDNARILLPGEQKIHNKDVYNLFEIKVRQQQQQQYMKGIAENVETPCNITITVVGHNGVGKSCFVRQVKQENIPEGGPGSTDTADFHVNFLGYNPDTGFRKAMDTDGEIETGRQRLKRIIDRYRKKENNNVQSCTSTADLHMTETDEPDDEPDEPDDEPDEPAVNRPVWTAKKKTEVENVETPADKESLELDEISDDDEIPQHMEITQEQMSIIEQVMRADLEDKQEEEVKGYVTIYDFGGEKVFYNTHHCFMSSNMVFVLVFDVAMCLDQSRAKDGYERIEFWLKHIATYAVDKAGQSERTPPIILVGSHLDLLSENKEEQENFFVSVIEKLYKKPELKAIIETHVQDMFPIANLNDSTKNQDIYQLLWNRILEIAPLQSQWKQPVPARWVALEHELVRIKNGGRIILTYVDLLEINSKTAVPLSEDEVMQFLMKLRFSGSFLCFDLHSKSPFIVLQPQWIIHAFKAIITDKKFKPNLTIMQRLRWAEYERSGVLTMDFIKTLWGISEGYRLLEEEDRLYIVMETLGLLAKPISDDGDVDYFIVPSILQTADPDKVRPLLADPNIVTTVTLCVKFDNPFIPQAVWDKMIASCIHRFRRLHKCGYDDLQFLQRGFACLSVDCLWDMIINCVDNAMKITMFKKDTDEKVPTGTGVNLLKVLDFLLQRILKLNHQSHLGYQFYLHNDFRFSPDEKIVNVNDLRKNPRLECDGSNGPGWIEREDIYIWFKNPNQETKQTPCQFSVAKGLPDRTLSFQEVGRVSKYIGKTYQTFFVELDCPIEIVEQEMEDNRHLAFRSKMTKILIHFLRTKPDTGFQAIAEAMSRHGMDPTKLENVLDENRRTVFHDEALHERWLSADVSFKDIPAIVGSIDVKAQFNLFLELGILPKTVDDFDYNFQTKGTRQKITALLEFFIEETKPRPTWNAILLAMHECEMDTESLIRTLKPK